MARAGRRNRWSTPWPAVLAYGGLIAGASLALDWLDYRRVVRSQPGEVYVAIVALMFLALGVFAGIRLARAAPPPPAGNAAASDELGLSVRELAVLREIADGHSTKEIARRLHISPNTVKTHVARLLEKLGARRRTDALARARQLGLLP